MRSATQNFGILISVLGLFALGACGQDEEAAQAPATETAAPATEDAEAPREPTPEEAAAAKLDQILAGDWREEKNRARDVYRNPKETLTFFGLQPSMTVVEVWPGGGWYTDIIAPFVKDDGKYYAAGFDPETDNERIRDSIANFQKKYIDDAEKFGTVTVTVFGPNVGDIAPAGSADMVLTFRNVHNWVPRGYAQEGFVQMYRALKPGGILGVVDHRLPADVEADEKLESGYIHEAAVIELAEKAGFVLDGSSDINNNKKDTADHPFGVWTLPPVLRSAPRGEPADESFDQSKYQEIGESDRFTLRFKKPE